MSITFWILFSTVIVIVILIIGLSLWILSNVKNLNSQLNYYDNTWSEASDVVAQRDNYNMAQIKEKIAPELQEYFLSVDEN